MTATSTNEASVSVSERRERLGQHRIDRPVHQHRLAEVAGGEARGPAPVLQPQRIVEAELQLQRLDLLGRRERPEDQVRDTAGQDAP